MSLFPHESFPDMEHFRRQMDRLFNQFHVAPGHQELGSLRIDVYETESEVVASFEIPGIKSKDDIKIEVENHTLSIGGTINHFKEVKEEQHCRREGYYGRFHRMISLPSPVDWESVNATYRNGVLEIRLPKLLQQRGRSINIEFFH